MGEGRLLGLGGHVGEEELDGLADVPFGEGGAIKSVALAAVDLQFDVAARLAEGVVEGEGVAVAAGAAG